MMSAKVWEKEAGDSTTRFRAHHDETWLPPNPCGGCTLCHQMTRIHRHGGPQPWPGGEPSAGLDRPCAARFFQRHLGNRHLQHLGERSQSDGGTSQQADSLVVGVGPSVKAKAPVIQTKLIIGEPEDEFEREADRIADLLMSEPALAGDHHSTNTALIPGQTQPSLSCPEFPEYVPQLRVNMRSRAGQFASDGGSSGARGEQLLSKELAIFGPTAPTLNITATEERRIRRFSCGAWATGEEHENLRAESSCSSAVTYAGSEVPPRAPCPARAGLLQRRYEDLRKPGVDGECEDCRNKELGVQRLAAASAGPTMAPPIVREVLSSPGRPLDTQTRAFMERRFGHLDSQVRVYTLPAPQARLPVNPPEDDEREADQVAESVMHATGTPTGARHDFSHVRVHTDAKAEASARMIGASAYTVGSHVVFGAGRYAPASAAGRRLIAHELVHVLQQTASRAFVIQRECSDPSFCTPYDTPTRAATVKARILSIYMPIDLLKFGPEANSLYIRFLLRHPGDSLAPVVFDNPSSPLVSSFSESGDTEDDMDDVIDLVGSRLSRAPGPLKDNTPTMMSLSNFLSAREMNERPINYSNPFSVPGHIAGDIGSSDAGPDYRKITYANVTLERTPVIGSTGYVSVQLTPHYEVFDAVDFCPGDCGSLAEQQVTVPMSRLEESGEAYDVPFKVIFSPDPRSKRFWYS